MDSSFSLTAVPAQNDTSGVGCSAAARPVGQAPADAQDLATRPSVLPSAPLPTAAQDHDWSAATADKGCEPATGLEQDEDGASWNPIFEGSPPDDSSSVWVDREPTSTSLPEVVADRVEDISALAAANVAATTGDIASDAANATNVHTTADAAASISPPAADVTARAGATESGSPGEARVNATSGASVAGYPGVAASNVDVRTMCTADELPPVDQPSIAQATDHSVVAAETATLRTTPCLESPMTALDCISFVLRAAFRVRSKRDESIFPFIGIAYVVAKLSFLATTTDDLAMRVLHATIVELFSTPVNALKFMENAFQVAPKGLHLGGRLKKSRHVSGQPPMFRAVDFSTFFNPQGKLTQWLSRALCLREAITFGQDVSHGRGGLTRLELDSLAARLQSPSYNNAAASAGCRINYCKAADNSLAVSEVIFTWDFQPGVDDRINTMLRILRPKLLKSPPQTLTQATTSHGAVVLSSSAVEGQSQGVTTPDGPQRPSATASSVPVGSQPVLFGTQALGSQLAAVAAAAHERVTSAPAAILPTGSNADDHGPVGSCAGSSARAGQTTPVVAAPSGGGAAGIAKRSSTAKGHVPAKVKGATGGKGNTSRPSFRKGKNKKQRASRIELSTCLCGSGGTTSGGASYVVAEVRHDGRDVLLGMAIGVQLSWSTDTMMGGRLDLTYCLSLASRLTGSSAHHYILNVDQTNERTSTRATITRSVVSQLPSLQTNYMSLDFASVVERQCVETCAASVASPPAIASDAVETPDAGCGTFDESIATGPSDGSGPAVLPDTIQETPLERLSTSPVSQGMTRGRTPSAVEDRGLLNIAIVDAPLDVSPLALTISFRAPSALDAERGRATRTPGRLILFFPVIMRTNEVMNRC